MASSTAAPVPGPAPRPVEARSLSSITTIASNPPAYPRNPTAKKLDPLVLYIVRVPGSKDLFLTPLKPPTKSHVSAEEIYASLYYVHIATPEDEAVLRRLELERREQDHTRQRDVEALNPDVQAAIVRLNNVRRKPIASTSPSRSSGVKPPFWSQDQQERRVDVQDDSVTSPPIPRRPCPLVPRETEPLQAQQSSGNDRHEHEGLGRRLQFRRRAGTDTDLDVSTIPLRKENRWSALSGYFNHRTMRWEKDQQDVAPTARRSLDSTRLGAGSTPYSGNVVSLKEHEDSLLNGVVPIANRDSERPDFRITLIRRDPTHGSQWNVATISSIRGDPGAVNIEVDTPGYSRFAASKAPIPLTPLGVNSPSVPASFGRPTSPKQQGIVTPTPLDLSLTRDGAVNPRKFHRQLRVSRAQHEPEHSHDRSPHSSLEFDHSVSGGGMYSSKHSHGASSTPKLERGYYTFTSPWNGICTFSMSVNGRSLKCKHVIPSLSSAKSGTHHSAVTVAEIRFNIPFPPSHHHRYSQSAASSSPSHRPIHQARFKDKNEEGRRREGATTSCQSSPTTMATTDDQKSKKRVSPLAVFFNSATASSSHSSTAGLFRRPRAISGASAHSNYSTSSASATDSATTGSKENLIPNPNPNLSTASSSGRDQQERLAKGWKDSKGEEDDRLDFSLAHERAGGGLRGKSVKLGKLVIEDEGIKMLDLVVAACMAVWWKGDSSH